MKLTGQELKLIEPGIYRTWIPTVDGFPLSAGESISSDSRLVHLLEEVKTRKIGNPIEEGVEYSCFFSNPDQFLDAWISGYTDFRDSEASHFDFRQKGFEMYYVNWHSDQEMFDKAGSGYPPTIMLATDTNNPYFGEGYMNIGINDLPNQRCLVWKGAPLHEHHKIIGNIRDASKAYPIDEVLDMEKEFSTRDQFTINRIVTEKFPLASPNIEKATGNQWILIGYDPSQVYAGFERLKFNFPVVSYSQG